MLADEECVRAGLEQSFDIVLGVYAAFDNKQPVFRNKLCQPHRRIEIDIEGFEISIIHAYDRCAGLQSFRQFGLIMNFNQSIEL